MAVDAGLALQKALYGALLADEMLEALIDRRIYDNVPGDAVFPYLTIGDAWMSDWGSDTHEGAEHRLSFHVYARSGGRGQIKEIIGQLNKILNGADPDLEDHNLVNLHFLDADIARLIDGITWHGTVRYRAVTEAD